MRLVKILAMSATVVASTMLLAGCDSMHSDPNNPADGFWVDTQLGDVWCVDGSNWGGDSTTCQWSSLTSARHENARHLDSSYHYLKDVDGKSQKVLCIDFEVRGYNVMDCNWPQAIR